MGALEKTCKPDSVPPPPVASAGVIISLGIEFPRSSSDLPGDFGRASLVPRPTGRSVVSVVPLFGLAPGDACRAVCVATDAVGSYPAVSPLPDPRG